MTKKTYYCEDCPKDYSTTDKSNFNKHRKSCLYRRENPRKKRVFMCEHCDYSSTDGSNYKRHLSTHTNRDMMILKLVRQRGLMKRHKGRMEKSKDDRVRAESTELYTKAREKAVMLVKCLKALD